MQAKVSGSEVVCQLVYCFCFQGEEPAPVTLPAPGEPTSTSVATPFGIANPPADKICDYSVVSYGRKAFLGPENQFDPRLLEKARSCGTKVVLRPVVLSNLVIGKLKPPPKTSFLGANSNFSKSLPFKELGGSWKGDNNVGKNHILDIA